MLPVSSSSVEERRGADSDPQMLFTWSTQDLCIVFRWWHISGLPTLTISLLAIVALGAAYEALRSVSRRYETFVNKRQDELPSESIPILPGPSSRVLKSSCSNLSNWNEAESLFVEMDPLLRERLSFGQDATRSKLASGRMLSRRLYMRRRRSMRLC